MGRAPSDGLAAVSAIAPHHGGGPHARHRGAHVAPRTRATFMHAASMPANSARTRQQRPLTHLACLPLTRTMHPHPSARRHCRHIYHARRWPPMPRPPLTSSPLSYIPVILYTRSPIYPLSYIPVILYTHYPIYAAPLWRPFSTCRYCPLRHVLPRCPRGPLVRPSRAYDPCAPPASRLVGLR